MSKLIDLTGKRFGRLIVIRRMDHDKWGHSTWLCQCDCGKEKIIRSDHLLSNKIQSCGCLHNEGNNIRHGHNKKGEVTKEYKAWGGMKQRCTNPSDKAYSDYGGRGITVCKRWLKFENFLEDMGECPIGLTLDRKNNNKNYCKSNCRWTTPQEQARNTRKNLYVTYNGIT